MPVNLAPYSTIPGNILIKIRNPENKIQNIESSILTCDFCIRFKIHPQFRIETMINIIRSTIDTSSHFLTRKNWINKIEINIFIIYRIERAIFK